MKKVDVYTDGACLGNPGSGGWGAILIYTSLNGDTKTKELFGHYDALTTNNAMELLAVISALETLKESCEVNLYTDSKYVQQGMTSWIKGWKENGWKNSKKEEVKNINLWKRLEKATINHKVNFIWVKGHGNDHFNEIADSLAKRGASAVIIQ